MVGWIIFQQQKMKIEDYRKIINERNGGNILNKLFKGKRSAQLKIYTAQEMEIATKKYSHTRVVNQLVFYRATLDNRQVDVMKIPETVPQSKIEQFIKEVYTLSRRRGNVIRVSGCCLETSFPLLVYELHVDESRTLCGCMRGGGGGVLDLESGEVEEEEILTKLLEGEADAWKNFF